MGNVPKSATERTFQENFVKKMQHYRWEAPERLNGNTHKVTTKDLIANWRNELNRINADQLEGVALTDNEFLQVLAKVNQISNSYEAAKILAAEDSTGKIDGIYRDAHPQVTRKQITLTIFKKAEVRGGDSSYQIAREVWTDCDNRFDIVLLINGLPLINVEQKRADKTMEEAFRQFYRYYRDGEYCNNFMAFSQMMVVCSEIEMRYFATPKSLEDFNPTFAFHWSDKENKRISQWEEVIDKFLMVPMAHQMVGDYLVINEAKNEEDRRHFLLRPYQVYALQAVELAAFGQDNADGLPHGGYVWHTTGSGKTITSFKTALFLSTRAGFDKIVFLVDRRELDANTSDRFKAYAVYDAVRVDDTAHTYQLKKLLQNPQHGIVVTTTFKLNSLVKELQEKGDHTLQQKKFVFIIDEAHRTTMGQMMGTIKEYFRQTGLFYGFTGTPLFDENNAKGMVNAQSEVINTTEKLFGPQLHQYTIDEAIADGNVLGFHVDYINTGEFKSYEDLREQIIAVLQLEYPQRPQRSIERDVQGWDDTTVEEEAAKRKVLQYNDKTHIPKVVEEILAGWEGQSQGRTFNAILTVASIKRVLAYYEEFKKQLKNWEKPLHVEMTFSFGNENDSNPVSESVVQEMFEDYGSDTGITFTVGDKKHGEEAYFSDLISRAQRGGSGRNARNIDLIIVAKQLLTGYDSKWLNTLYVDCDLELQGLIQAYSRTNRVLGKSKEFGTIINFRYPRMTERAVIEALKLYGSGGKSSKAIVDTYEVAVDKLKHLMLIMMETLSNPADWPLLEKDEQQKKIFITAYKNAAKQLTKVAQYYGFIWDDGAFGMDEHTWLLYRGAYRNVRDKDDDGGDPVELPVLEKTKIAGTTVVNADYILKLIGKKTTNSNGFQRIDEESLRLLSEKIQELSNLGEAEQAGLLRGFLKAVQHGEIVEGMSADDAFDQWKAQRYMEEVQSFADDWGMDAKLLRLSVDAFSLKEADLVPRWDDLTHSIDLKKAKKPQGNNFFEHIHALYGGDHPLLPQWMADMKRKYC